ncbi:PspC domain-containing protein [Microbacterium sp. KNMS]
MTESEPRGTEMTSAVGADGGAPAVEAPSRRPGGGFFDWVRSLGLVRTEGWIGGVCAAIARRTGADPVIVRGIFVVAAVLGFPALWLYALGWALLPDERGDIAIRLRTGSGPALVGIAIMIGFGALASWASATLMEDFLALAYPGRIVWTAIEASFWIAVVAALAAFALWLVRRERPVGGVAALGPGRTALIVLVCVAAAIPILGIGFGVVVPAIFGYGSPVALLVGLAAVAAIAALGIWAGRRIASPVSGGGLGGVQGTPAARGTAGGPAVPPFEPAPSPEPPADGDFDAWRRQHEEWREQHDAWRAQQTDAERLAREEERTRRQQAARAFAEEAARVRAARRATRPRISLAFGASTLGLALVAGSAAALVVLGGGTWPIEPERASAALAAAAFAMSAVAAGGMVIAGALRRRSGALAALAVIALAAGAGTALGANNVIGANSWQTIAVDGSSYEVTRAYGSLELWLMADGGGEGSATVVRRAGFTQVTVPPDIAADIRVHADDDTRVMVTRMGDAGVYESEDLPVPRDGIVEWAQDGAEADAPLRTVDITQTEGGEVSIWVLDEDEFGAAEPTPTPTAGSTGGLTPEPTDGTGGASAEPTPSADEESPR